jgi:hypothetical protein
MADKKPTITRLEPVVLSDNRRVKMELVVENLPDQFANVNFFMPDTFSGPRPQSARPDSNTPSPYPDIELCILDSQRQEAVCLFIVEHKESHTALTLHLPTPDVKEQYIARAEMTYHEQTLQVVETPFTLNPVD